MTEFPGPSQAPSFEDDGESKGFTWDVLTIYWAVLAGPQCSLPWKPSRTRFVVSSEKRSISVTVYGCLIAHRPPPYCSLTDIGDVQHVDR